MDVSPGVNLQREPIWNRILSNIGRVLLAVGIPLIAFYVLYVVFIFLRDSDAPRGLVALVAIVWGVGGVALLFWVFNGLVERFPDALRTRLRPFVFVGPAIAILAWYLTIPTLRTFWLSLFGRDGPATGLGFFQLFSSDTFVGLSNYVAVFTEDLMVQSFRNNLMWIIFGSTLSVLLGLIIAVLADRSGFERVAKSLVFLPLAISFVGAGIIWNFIYEYRPAGQAQIGLLNYIVVSLGGTPQAWPQWVAVTPWNNLFLIIIVIWLQAGFAMVLFSAALKGIPEELMEAGRNPALLPHHDPLHSWNHSNGLDHHRHLHPEDLRCGLGDDRGPIWHACYCDTVLSPILYQPQLGLWFSDRHRSVACRGARHDLQPAAIPGAGGVQMKTGKRKNTTRPLAC
jgi:ABC-type sugar transport system permease subunit